MPRSYKEIFQGLNFAWVEVPPPLPKKLYWGEASWHERRKAGHTSSFLALGLLINQIGESELSKRYLDSFNGPQMKHLLNENNYHLLAESKILCSRSHTDNWACAITNSGLLGQASLGVDIESKERVLKPGVERFYKNPNDFIESLQPIEIWCLKEASFKALSSYLNFHQKARATLVLTDIELVETGQQEIIFKFEDYRGTCGVLPKGRGPKGLCTAWALLRI